jgi:hypothetical protein
MSKQITIYTLAELKAQFPEAYKAVHERWKDVCLQDEVPYQQEIMESLKATIKACGGVLTNWNIGPYYPSWATVRMMNDNTETMPADEFKGEILKPLGYVLEDGKTVKFPGVCPFTGYWCDDEYMETVWEDLSTDVRPLRIALENLANVARQLMEDELEDEQKEETMLERWGDNYYTEKGNSIL